MSKYIFAYLQTITDILWNGMAVAIVKKRFETMSRKQRFGELNSKAVIQNFRITQKSDFDREVKSF
ncbi:MAG: hypothetical protein V1770_03830 [bacterium]